MNIINRVKISCFSTMCSFRNIKECLCCVDINQCTENYFENKNDTFAEIINNNIEKKETYLSQPISINIIRDGESQNINYGTTNGDVYISDTHKLVLENVLKRIQDKKIQDKKTQDSHKLVLKMLLETVQRKEKNKEKYETQESYDSNDTQNLDDELHLEEKSYVTINNDNIEKECDGFQMI